MTVARWKRLLLPGSLIVIAGVMVGACGGADPTATPPPTATRPAPTATVAAQPTAPPAATRPAATPPTGAQPTAAPAATRPAAAPTPIPTPTATAVPPTPTARTVEAKFGGTLNTGSATTPIAIGSYHVSVVPSGYTASIAVKGAYNNLLIFDPYQDNKVLVGELVESWTVGENGTRITMRLNKDAKWHDGTPFTGKDVIYNINIRKTPPQGYTSSGASFLATLKSVTAPDDKTAVLDFSQPSVSALARFTDYTAMNILPSHVPIASLGSKPIGTGAFMFDSARQDVSETWKRNPNYFLKDAAGRQLPYLDAVTWFSFRDATSMIAAYRTGQLRWLNNQQTSAVTGAKDEIARSVPGAQFYELANGPFGPVFKNVAPFSNPKVREAIDLWLDRKAFVDIGFLGIGCWYSAGTLCQTNGGKWNLPLDEMMKKPGWRYVDAQGQPVDTLAKAQAKRNEMKKDPQDQKRAKELLAEAGVKQGDVKVKVLVAIFEGRRGGPVFAAQMSELFGATWENGVVSVAAQWLTDVVSGSFTVAYGTANGTFGIDEPYVTLAPYESTNSAYYGGWPPDTKLDKLYADQDLELDFTKRQKLVWDLLRLVIAHPSRINVHGGGGYGTAWPEVRDIPLANTAASNIYPLHRVWIR